jgi:hypothetical protein
VIPPGASVQHLQHVLEALARLKAVAGRPLFPWAVGELPRGNSVVLAASEMSPQLETSIAQLNASGFKVLRLIAAAHPQVAAGGDAIWLTPGCDLAARLEGRG